MAHVNYQGRKIRGNKSVEIPRSLVFFDCETSAEKDKENENKHRLKLLLGVAKFVRLENGIETRKKEIVFSKSIQFWNWLTTIANRHRLTLCFAHNAIFDLCTVDLTEAEQKWGWKLAAPYQSRSRDKTESGKTDDNFLVSLDCPPLIICLQHEVTKARVIFLDTLNYFACPLEKLGETVGLPKLPICFDSFEWDEMVSYCERDVDIIKKAMLELMEWQKGNGLGNFRYTLPANAFNAYRHRFMPHEIITHDHEKAKQLERAAYYGGQTQVFSTERHNEKVYLLDVSSLYPSVMQSEAYPVRLLDFQENENGELQWDAQNGNKTIASVTTYDTALNLPRKTNSQTLYINGTTETTLPYPELSHAGSNNWIDKVYAVATYECQPIFTDFVQFFWDKREEFIHENRTIWAELCKLFLNSLSGKFAQLTAAWQFLDGVLSEKPWAQWITVSDRTGIIDHFRAIGNRVQIKGERVDHPNSFCAISAFVTSYGRMRMNTLRNLSGNENVYYQGVDSLVVNQCGMDKLVASHEIHGRMLGKLRLCETADTFHARGKMDYNFGNRRVVAGLKQNAIEIAADEFTQTLFSGVESLFAPAGEKQITTEECHFVRRAEPQH